ncbi:MAG: zeta toxin family protein [Betaproteobacteria bacterium]|nr:zeta toxin family protein [Betaproteobacteria bacterium]
MSSPRRAGPYVIVLAGPNGAGKSTFYDLFLDGLPVPFINADRIARTVFRGRQSVDYEAARIADAERRRLIAERQSFVMETVLSDPAGDKVEFLRRARDAGFLVVLVYIGLDSPELAAARVAHRVRSGGHDVPTARIGPRFGRSLANLRKALPIVDRAYLYDNSATPYVRVAVVARGRTLWRSARLPRWMRGVLPASDRK